MLSAHDIILRLLLAAVLGGVVGIERERHEWTAGLRTHMLVCIGAALAIIVSAFGFGDVLGKPQVTLDPSRIAAQVISGIGFLGAGTIIFLERENVIHGLTTAAGLWVVAAVGLAIGAGMYLAGIVATVIAWTTLALLKPIERRWLARPRVPRLQVLLDAAASWGGVEAAVTASGLALQKMSLHRHSGGDELELQFVEGTPADALARLADALRNAPGVRSITRHP